MASIAPSPSMRLHRPRSQIFRVLLMVRNTERPDLDRDISEQNFSASKDCLAARVLVYLAGSESGDSEDDLDEFSLYLAQEAWPALPALIQEPSYDSDPIPEVEEVSLDITPSFVDTLATYRLISSNDTDEAHSFLRHVLEPYVSLATKPLPVWSNTRTEECEICSRCIPLTYHHLIPRSTHARVIKRGWHPPEMLNSVAWLCRPCHSAVHAVASNEELAKEYYTLERLLERPDIQKWAKYAVKQRWGTRRG